MKTNVEWGEAESKISGTNVLYQARSYIATPLAGCASYEVSTEHFHGCNLSTWCSSSQECSGVM